MMVEFLIAQILSLVSDGMTTKTSHEEVRLAGWAPEEGASAFRRTGMWALDAQEFRG